MQSDVKINTSPLKIIPPSDLNGPLNIFIGEVNKENTCIICLDSENLIKNDRCSCIYYFHPNCIEQIINPNQCLLCKKELNAIQHNPLHTNQINLTIHIEDSQSFCCSVFLCVLLSLIIFAGIYTTIKLN